MIAQYMEQSVALLALTVFSKTEYALYLFYLKGKCIVYINIDFHLNAVIYCHIRVTDSEESRILCLRQLATTASHDILPVRFLTISCFVFLLQ